MAQRFFCITLLILFVCALRILDVHRETGRNLSLAAFWVLPYLNKLKRINDHGQHLWDCTDKNNAVVLLSLNMVKITNVVIGGEIIRTNLKGNSCK